MQLLVRGLDRVKDTLYLLELLLLAFLTISIYTYDANDPGYSSVGSVIDTYNRDIIVNKAGYIGAFVADFLFYYLGLATYTMIILCLISFISRIFNYNYKTVFSSNLQDFTLVLVFFPTLIISLSGLIAFIFPYTDIIWLPHGTGGVIGKSLVITSSEVIGRIGGQVVTAITILISATLLLNISFLNFIKFIMRFIYQSVTKPVLFFTTASKNSDSHNNSSVDNSLDSDAKNNYKTQDLANANNFEEEAEVNTNIDDNHSKPIDIKFAKQHKADVTATELKPDPQNEADTNYKKKIVVSKNANANVALIDNGIDPAANPLDIDRKTLDSIFSNAKYIDSTKSNNLQEVATANSDENKATDLEATNTTAGTATTKNAENSLKHFIPKRPVTYDTAVVDNIMGTSNAESKIISSYKKYKHNLPLVSLLEKPAELNREQERELVDYYKTLGVELIAKLEEFGVSAEVEEVIAGPVVTRFEIQPAAGVKASRISGLSQDIARSLTVSKVRVVEVIEGKSTIGIEIPNDVRKTVYMSDVIDAIAFQNSKSPITMILGQDISGEAVTMDLAKMPHLLVAGTTGSGKSVAVNLMILSLLFKSSPEQVRLIMIDPKMLELSVYEDIPHLLTPVVTDMNLASNSLLWSVAEMERRYNLMSHFSVRNIAGFNEIITEKQKNGEQVLDPLWRADANPNEQQAPTLDKLPYIVIVIDEFADMMMIVGKKVEQLIARIAQKARAAGIHLILATQRPSVDIITGLIKANIPSRIAFQVSSKIDSRTIIDQGGAEQLLGNGDMLYMPSGTSVPTRVHGAFVSDDEVRKVADFIREQGMPNYIPQISGEITMPEVPVPGFEVAKGDSADELLDQVIDYVLRTRKSSISGIQRKFAIGYNRAAKLVDKLEEMGVVSPPSANGNRQVLPPPPVD